MKKAIYLILLIFTATTARAQTITVQGTPFEINTEKETKIPVKLKLDKPLELHFDTVSAFAVRNGNVSSDAYLKGIRISWNPKLAALTLTVDPALLDAQGNYDVSLRYQSGNATDYSYLPLTLVRPPAVLTADKINIAEQGSTRKTDPLVITETGGKAGADGLRISSAYFPVVQGSLITLPAKPIKILPGGLVTIAYHLDPDLFDALPLGETVGKVQLMAGSVAAPIPVQIDIWKRLSKWWIVLTVFGGLLTGTFVRHFLKERKEREQARLNGLQLVQDIKSFTAAIEDPKLQADVNMIVQTVLTAISPENNAANLNGTTVITKAIEDARTAYNTRKATFQTQIDTETGLYTSIEADLFASDLPPQLNRALSDAQDSLKKAKAKLDVFNPTEAALWRAKTQEQEITGLTAYGAYVTGLLLFLVTPANYYPTIPATDPTLATVQALLAPAQTICTTTFGSGITDAHAALAAAKRIQTTLDQALTALTNGVIKYYNDTNQLAANHPNFKNAFNNWLKAIGDMISNPQGAPQSLMYWIPTLPADLNAAWTAALGVSSTTLGPGQPKPPAFAFVHQMFSVAQPPSPGTDLKTISMATLSASFKILYGRYIAYNLLQLFVLTLLMGAGGYLSYGKNFVGQPEEFISIFLFAFSLDIMADNITKIRAQTGT
ncbi:hypothetical protein J3L18_25690 [Mucilaginibacter gossypii]|uniref:hypothetical protein n=1 Tax=Mucilaginibacter gossypii TaxID=551996 RepID=UPI000DCCA100|nr:MULTISPECIES: hypothetical protein [Mucilaginibacter]QTE36491.1 hypothetical protein J3L18_25690 [Mucilaginibacter gossypii]RAV48651.1 hypothetical protein DIU36_28120 [Mucilaginibacter rubeus]